MKRSYFPLLLLSLLFIGCAGPRPSAPNTSAQVPIKRVPVRPSASFTSAQATQLAIRLANEQATRIYQCKPFHDGHPATFSNGVWRWHELGPGDYEADVELLADGTPNRITVNLLNDGGQIP